MQATTSLPIAALYRTPEQNRDILDAEHAFYVARARCQIRNALATNGTARGDGYAHIAACSLLEDLITSNKGAVLTLRDLAAAFATGADDERIAYLTRRMFREAIDLTAEQTADSLVEGEDAAKRFVVGVGQ